MTVGAVEKLPSNRRGESSADLCNPTTNETEAEAEVEAEAETGRFKRHDCQHKVDKRRNDCHSPRSKECRLTCLVVWVDTACNIPDIMRDCVTTWSPSAEPCSGLGLRDADVTVRPNHASNLSALIMQTKRVGPVRSMHIV